VLCSVAVRATRGAFDGRVRVRAHALDGRSTAWSDWIGVSVGLLTRHDWSGMFVGIPEAPEFRGALHFRRSFELAGPAERAVLHVTALGVFVPYLNGERIGDHVLDPGWTSYRHRICSTSFDVSEHLQEGENVLGATVADGWYRGWIGHAGGRLDF